MKFEVYDGQSAPEAAQPTLEAVENQFGFLPNLFGVLAQSPAALEAYATLGQALKKAGLNSTEQHVVFLTLSEQNDCGYCVAAHSTVAKAAGMPDEVLKALRDGGEIPDPRLQALSRFAAAVQEQRGWVSNDDVEHFEAAGYGEREALDVLTILAMKTLSNYTNHLADTPLDDAFADQAWKGE